MSGVRLRDGSGDQRNAVLTAARARNVVSIPGGDRWQTVSRGSVVTAIEAAAPQLGVIVKTYDLVDPDDAKQVDAVFARMAEEGSEAVLGLQGAPLYRQRTYLANVALRHRLPLVFDVTDYAHAGAFMAYSPSFPDLYRRAASYVDRILRGASPSDLPVEQPTMFELVINLKTACALGLTMPPSLLLRADQVID